MTIISDVGIARRRQWIGKIETLTGDFATNSLNIDNEIDKEVNKFGTEVLLDHLRLCGNIPELYKHDSTEEKQYSKYSDSLLSHSFRAMGLNSLVITARADVADVEAVCQDYSFVADAKTFRLSRTAKNQKDFKVQAMHRWKHGKPYAMVVCPIYQLPKSSSQIYEQASRLDVCVFTYSHLSLLVRYSKEVSQTKSQSLLFDIFRTITAMNPSKSANDYWLAINKLMLASDPNIKDLWQDEKLAVAEVIKIGKEDDLSFLASEREKIMKMTHQQAINELIKISNIDNKIRTIKSVSENNLFSLR